MTGPAVNVDQIRREARALRSVGWSRQAIARLFDLEERELEQILRGSDRPDPDTAPERRT